MDSWDKKTKVDQFFFFFSSNHRKRKKKIWAFHLMNMQDESREEQSKIN